MSSERQQREEELYRQVTLAQQEYRAISLRFDALNREVRARTHGMTAPDGLQAIINLGNQQQTAFEKYSQALQAFSHFILGRGK